MGLIDKVYNISGNSVEPAFKIMAQFSTSHQALVTLTSGLMDGLDIPVPGLPFADMVSRVLSRVLSALISDVCFCLCEKVCV